ncbi:hypothetical protein BTJ40_10640 [Microbulbifer sp. A4B17]|uniref:hypothetical protein n=1 Tax=Microbulbifer sp. A4B17 TaxID=359370 RepID=UPI000D52E802|nr:hypothetical protein [Microbulbifer sp. A4B17]AWF81239.1 hypothetical protein BTJ40_10640 [Microbulbifer sp. A4B17]
MKNKVYFWMASIVVFLLGRILFSDLWSLGTFVGGIVYGLVMAGFIIPYIFGANIQIPSYTHILVKGKDDLYRFIYFLLSIFICIFTLLAP